MPLNDLSYDELCHLRRIADMLWNAHPSLCHLGAVHFDLTPGADVMIRIEARVPDLLATGAPAARPAALQVAPSVAAALEVRGPQPGDPDYRFAIPEMPETPTLSAPQASLDETELAYLEPATPDSRPVVDAPVTPGGASDGAEVAAGDGGAAVAASAISPPVADTTVAPDPVPPIATTAFPPDLVPAAGTTTKPAPWTAAEDDQLVQGVVTRVQNGMSLNAAAAATAAALGRPAEGTKFRVYTKLKPRIDYALTMAIPAAAPEPAPEPAPIPAPGPTVAPTDDLSRHLAELRRKGSWTVAEDIEMLELMALNWTMQDIAIEMKLDGAELKRRWDALSDLHEADEGRKLRSFTAAQLLAALKPEQAA